MLHLKLLQAALIALLVIITLRLSKMTVVVPMNLIVLVNVVAMRKKIVLVNVVVQQ